jgi:hypothetical protein
VTVLEAYPEDYEERLTEGEELDRIVGADASARGVELARGANRREAPAGSSSLA